jgi:hypothetical protein
MICSCSGFRGKFFGQVPRSNGAVNSVIDKQSEDGADYRYQQAIQIKTANATRAEDSEQNSSDYGAQNAKHNIEKCSLAVLIHDLAGDEACHEA